MNHERAHLRCLPLDRQKVRRCPVVFFAAIMVLQFPVVLLIYPETKGVTLEQLQAQLGTG